ncbi:hypothetical protein FY050_16375 [Phyllobacterium endophyticum]|uniref:Uncharacterized protein n=1 Tax=Phyllobacterium endophyticum TaxID=1149773 RepID=A0A2P7B295_9HYPH|nr:hypothetical protein CU100_07850 [Phyllobacterium endophyticum]TYR42744.1 hypothetical protein FY050_16375 [Phyllobacterium endophyticum]
MTAGSSQARTIFLLRQPKRQGDAVWRLETGDWRLETGDWRLETGACPPAPVDPYLASPYAKATDASDSRSCRSIRP